MLGVPSTAAETVVTNGVCCCEFCGWDAAQQLSACAWVTGPCDSCDSPSCIGQCPPSVQHAIRASGVDAHPAQRVALPARRATQSANAVRRWPGIITWLGCSTGSVLSNINDIDRDNQRAKKVAVMVL